MAVKDCWSVERFGEINCLPFWTSNTTLAMACDPPMVASRDSRSVGVHWLLQWFVDQIVAECGEG